MCDMRFIINYIQEKLQQQNLGFEPREAITLRKVNVLFAAVNDEFLVNPRDVQKSWISAVRRLRVQKSSNNNNTEDLEENVEIDEYDSDNDLD
jgi:hypothetical protein